MPLKRIMGGLLDKTFQKIHGMKLGVPLSHAMNEQVKN